MTSKGVLQGLQVTPSPEAGLPLDHPEQRVPAVVLSMVAWQIKVIWRLRRARQLTDPQGAGFCRDPCEMVEAPPAYRCSENHKGNDVPGRTQVPETPGKEEQTFYRRHLPPLVASLYMSLAGASQTWEHMGITRIPSFSFWVSSSGRGPGICILWQTSRGCRCHQLVLQPHFEQGDPRAFQSFLSLPLPLPTPELCLQVALASCKEQSSSPQLVLGKTDFLCVPELWELGPYRY